MRFARVFSIRVEWNGQDYILQHPFLLIKNSCRLSASDVFDDLSSFFTEFFDLLEFSAGD